MTRECAITPCFMRCQRPELRAEIAGLRESGQVFQREAGRLCVERNELRAETERLKAENAELRARIDEGLPTANDVHGIMREHKP